MRFRTLRRAVLTISCAALIAGSTPAMAQEDSSSGVDSGGVVPDLLIVRPVALLASVLGTAIFLVALPFTLPTRTVGDVANVLVVRPLEYTFNRPLGDFDHCGATRHACGE
jgi:hypothetical protein